MLSGAVQPTRFLSVAAGIPTRVRGKRCQEPFSEHLRGVAYRTTMGRPLRVAPGGLVYAHGKRFLTPFAFSEGIGTERCFRNSKSAVAKKSVSHMNLLSSLCSAVFYWIWRAASHRLLASFTLGRDPAQWLYSGQCILPHLIFGQLVSSGNLLCHAEESVKKPSGS